MLYLVKLYWRTPEGARIGADIQRYADYPGQALDRAITHARRLGLAVPDDVEARTTPVEGGPDEPGLMG